MMGRDIRSAEQPVASSDVLIDQARILAARLAAGRSARPVVIVSEHQSRLPAILVAIGEELVERGHETIIVDDPETAGAKIASAAGAVGHAISTARATVFLVARLEDLDGKTLGTLLDVLHLAARDGIPLGCVATGTTKIRALLGNSRSFAEMLVEFRSIDFE